MLDTVDAWEFDASCDLAESVCVARERVRPPTLRGHLLSSHGDALTLQLVEGQPRQDGRTLLYVAGYGAFVVGRWEEWPPLPGCTATRLLLTLLAFPQPSPPRLDRSPR